MLKKYFQLESILNNINPTKKEMIYFINEINDLSNIKIKGYINDWLKNSINLMVFNIYNKSNFKDELYNNLDVFPYFISVEDITGKKTIHFKSKIIGKINDEEGVFYYKGHISEDLLLTNNNYYYDVFKTKNDDHVKESKNELEISNELEYIKEIFNISKDFWNILKDNKNNLIV